MGKVNPWLADKLEKTHSPRTIGLVVSVEDTRQIQRVRGLISAIPGVGVGRTAFNMISVTAPPGAAAIIAQVPGVKTVSYDMPVGIRAAPSIIDPLMGRVSISSVEIPFTAQEMAIRFGPNLAGGVLSFPFRLAQQFLGIASPMGQIQNPNVIIVPSGKVRTMIGAPDENKVHIKCAVLDTGVSPNPMLHLSKWPFKLESTVGEPPGDLLGHGTWVLTAAFGDSYTSRFGLCRGVADAEKSYLMSVKVLSSLGFGSTFGIIEGMAKAVDWGAQVVNMSLGSDQQGPVDDDPVVQIIERNPQVLWIVAAGNSGPDGWTIGSPAIAPSALTIGSFSPVYNELSLFSSRGPSGAWYKDHQSEWRRDLARYGEALIKPDLCEYGGGPAHEGQKTDLIYSAVVGWIDGMNDGTPLDLMEGLRGTSMATPIAAGLIALALEKGLIGSVADVKRKMARAQPKNAGDGYGLLTWGSLQ